MSVQDVSCETPGMMSKRTLRAIMRTTWIVQAPVRISHQPRLGAVGPSGHTFGVDPVGIQVG